MMEDKDIEEYNKIGWELKWNKRFIYPKSQRDIVMGRRHYAVSNQKITICNDYLITNTDKRKARFVSQLAC